MYVVIKSHLLNMHYGAGDSYKYFNSNNFELNATMISCVAKGMGCSLRGNSDSQDGAGI